MKRFVCTVARSPREIEDAQRVRWRVYGEEEQMISRERCTEGREIDRRDDRADTIHLLVYAGREPVGTVRLLLAASSAGGHCLDLDLESEFELDAFASPGVAPAEVRGYCVLRDYRCTGVTLALYAGLRAESARRGITHWVAAANMETDFPEDAALAYAIAQDRKLVSTCFHARRRSHETPSTSRRRPCFSDRQRALGLRGDRDQLVLPRTLSLLANKMGARFMGPPVYDTYFNVFALPLVTTLV